MIEKYKRLMIVNDDEDEAAFLGNRLENTESAEKIAYFQNMNDALKYIESEEFRCDKILLDIKISWNIDADMTEKVRKHLDIDAMVEENGEYGGFILFMYLVAKGFPIERIAFLSAYIAVEDKEEAGKKAIIEFLEKQKYRKASTDQALKELIDKVPSQKAHILRILENKSYAPREMTPYAEISKLLSKDTERVAEGTISENANAYGAASAFFENVKVTGLLINNRIYKGDTEKLKHWLYESDEMESYYNFRWRALNACEELIKYYRWLGGEKSENIKEKGIYRCVEKQNVNRVLEKYPPRYFEDMCESIKDILTIDVSQKQLEHISNHVINTLLAYWEGINAMQWPPEHMEKSSFESDLKNYSASMVMKFTRNWKMHNLIKDVDAQFMYFLFELTVYLLSGNSDLGNFDIKYIECSERSGTKSKNAETVADIFREVNEQLKKEIYELDLYNLFDKYGRDKKTKLKISMKDIYTIFYLCLHYPEINKAEMKVVFHASHKWAPNDSWAVLEVLAYEKIVEKGN